MKRVLLFFLLTFFFCGASAQVTCDTIFEKMIGKPGRTDVAEAAVEMDSGLFIYAGIYVSSSIYNAYRIMLTDVGDTLWTQEDTIPAGQAIADGDGNIVFTEARPPSSGTAQWRISKSDVRGNVLWSSPFFSFGICNRSNFDLIKTMDGGYAVTGYYSRTTCNLPVYDSYLVKFDSTGTILWSKTYTGNFHLEMLSVRQLPDSGYALGGWGAGKFYLMRTDTNGDTLWTGNYGDNQVISYGFDMDVTPDGGFILSGVGGDSTQLYKTDANGIVQWTKKYTRDAGGRFTQVISDPDGGYGMIAYEYNVPASTFSSLFLKLDANGIEQYRFYPFKTQIVFRNFMLLSDSSYLITGSGWEDVGSYTNSYVARLKLHSQSPCTQIVFDTIPVYDTLLVTVHDTLSVFDTTSVMLYDTTHVTVFDTTSVTIIDSIAVTDTLIIEVNLTGVFPPEMNVIKVYPNPTSDHLSIDNGNYLLLNNYSLTITNASGQTVFQSVINQQQFSINLSTFGSNGTYFVSVYDDQSQLVETRKIILQ